MFKEFDKGIVVANAKAELLELADSLGGQRVHRADRAFAAGVEEGLVRFGVLSDAASPS